MIAYRIQDAKRGTGYLLDPETQYSYPMSDDESLVRHGVSGCQRLSELAAYWATHCVEAVRPVLVRIEGPESQDVPNDREFGEVLVLPHTAEIIDGEAVFECISDLIDAIDEDYTVAQWDTLVDKAAEILGE